MRKLVKILLGSVLVLSTPVIAEETLAISMDEQLTFEGAYVDDGARVEFQSVQIPDQRVELRVRLNGTEHRATYLLGSQNSDAMFATELSPEDQAALYNAAEAARAYAKNSQSDTPVHMAVLIGAMNLWSN